MDPGRKIDRKSWESRSRSARSATSLGFGTLLFVGVCAIYAPPRGLRSCAEVPSRCASGRLARKVTLQVVCPTLAETAAPLLPVHISGHDDAGEHGRLVSQRDGVPDPGRGVGLDGVVLKPGDMADDALDRLDRRG